MMAASAQRLELCVAEAVAAIVGEAPIDVARPPGQLRHQPFALAAPQIDGAPLRQPARVAHVVRMEVGDEDAANRLPVEVGIQHALPQLTGPVETDARVDDGPAVAILEEVEVDVVEPEG